MTIGNLGCARPGALEYIVSVFYLLVFYADALAVDKPKNQELGDTTCAVDQVLKYSGTDWQCADDSDSDTLGAQTCGNGEVVKSDGAGSWYCAPDDTGIPSSDTLANLSCNPRDVARFNGTTWECSDAVSKLELLHQGKRVFLSSTLYNGNFGGLAGADLACQGLAQAVSLPGRYRAWLSDGTGSPYTRFTQPETPYILVDGTVVANDWADLTDGNIQAMINLDENGTLYPPSAGVSVIADQVWSSTNEDGTNNQGGAFSCQSWGSASNADIGLIGSYSSTETPSDTTEVDTGSAAVRLGWTRMQTELTPGSASFGEAFQPCDSLRRVYCFQQ